MVNGGEESAARPMQPMAPIDWQPHIAELRRHLDDTAVSAFLLGGLLNDLERSPHGSTRFWRFAATRDADGTISACAALRHSDGLCLIHGTDPTAIRLLAEGIDAQFDVRKLSGEDVVIRSVLESPRLAAKVTRSHREHFMILRAFTHRLEPDGNYRFANEDDIPRLKEYAAGYASERRVPFRRDWRQMCREGRVLVADALGPTTIGRRKRRPIASCLLLGTSFGPYLSCGGVYTFPEYRGQGYARRLLTNFSLLAFAAGYDVCLLVDEENEPAIRSYQHVGFQAVDLYSEVYLAAGGTMRSIPM